MIGSSDEYGNWLQTHNSQSSKLRVANDDGKRVLLEDIELDVKTTQTDARREEKGLQVSIGRHSNKPPPILLQTASQTERSPLYDSVKEKIRVYRALLKFYLTAFLIVVSSAMAAYFSLKYWKGPPTNVDENVEPPMGQIAAFFSNFIHKCLYCPQHR